MCPSSTSISTESLQISTICNERNADDKKDLMRLGKMIGLPYTVLSIAKRIIQEKKARPTPPSKKWEIERPKEEKNYGSSPQNDQCDEATGHVTREMASGTAQAADSLHG